MAFVAFAEPTFSLWLLLLVGTAAVLYSSVGHGGASGYLAAMALFGLDPALMKPVARPVTESERVATLAALTRVLAETQYSTIQVPPSDNSAMDGYVVVAGDIPAESETQLPIVQRIAAGYSGARLLRGTAARIFTGGPIPEGGDSNSPPPGFRDPVFHELGEWPGAHSRERGDGAWNAGGFPTVQRVDLVAASKVCPTQHDQ